MASAAVDRVGSRREPQTHTPSAATDTVVHTRKPTHGQFCACLCCWASHNSLPNLLPVVTAVIWSGGDADSGPAAQHVLSYATGTQRLSLPSEPPFASCLPYVAVPYHGMPCCAPPLFAWSSHSCSTERLAAFHGCVPPTPRAWHTMNAIGDRLYIFGGRNAAGIVGVDDPSLLIVYDVVANHWVRVTAAGKAPSPRSSHRTVVLGNRIILYGGASAGGHWWRQQHQQISVSISRGVACLLYPCWLP